MPLFNCMPVHVTGKKQVLFDNLSANEIQSTFALRTPRYYGHPTNAEKSQPPPGETHKEMTDMNSRYYGNADTFLPPSATFHLFFLSLQLTLEYFVKNPDSHNIKDKATFNNKGKMTKCTIDRFFENQ